MCFEYDGCNTLQDQRVVTTRKPHRCDGCSKTIGKGSQAVLTSGLYDGGWFRGYVCDRCTRLQYAIVEKEIKGGCPWHTAWISADDLRDYLHELRSYGEDIKPLGMRSLQDCRRYLDDLWLNTIGYARPDETERLTVKGTR